jgi:hypothetical protein
MSENKYFREALTNFTHNAASGGAIAHLADLGYAPREIRDMLDFPTPYERVQETFWNHLVEKRIIVEDQSDLTKNRETVHFVTDHDPYGRTSIRRVVETEESEEPMEDPDTFRSIVYEAKQQGPFAEFLKAHCGFRAYVSCDFGLRKEFHAQGLSERQRLYIEGIPWRHKIVWHQLDLRMAEIIGVLQEQASYHGEVLLLEEKVRIIF